MNFNDISFSASDIFEFKRRNINTNWKIWCSNSAVDFCLEGILFITRPEQQLLCQLFFGFPESFKVNSDTLFPPGLGEFDFPCKPFTFGIHFTINPCSLNIYDMIWYDMVWYDMLWCDVIYDILYDVMWYMIWYIWCDMVYDDTIWYMIWYDMIWYMIWYDMIRYDMITYDMMMYLLTAIGLTPDGSSTERIYTHTIHRTTQLTQTIHRTTQLIGNKANG
jgi:hypothetical protein